MCEAESIVEEGDGLMGRDWAIREQRMFTRQGEDEFRDWDFGQQQTLCFAGGRGAFSLLFKFQRGLIQESD